jgi:hypothetical protein
LIAGGEAAREGATVASGLIKPHNVATGDSGPLYFSASPYYKGIMRHLSKVGAALLRLVAVAGPVLLGLLTALYIGRPSPYFLATGIMLAVAILACDGWIIARRHWITAGFALAPDCILDLRRYLRGVAALGAVAHIGPVAASIATWWHGDLRAPDGGESSHCRFRVPRWLALSRRTRHGGVHETISVADRGTFTIFDKPFGFDRGGRSA